MMDWQGRPYIVFGLNTHKFALHVEHVTEISEVLPTYAMPEMPPHVMGVFRFRGRVVPLINLKVRLGLTDETAVNSDEERFIVVDDGGSWLGLKVDMIDEVVQIDPSQLDVLSDSADDPTWTDVCEGVWSSGGERVLVLKYEAVIDPDRKITLAHWQEALTQ